MLNKIKFYYFLRLTQFTMINMDQKVTFLNSTFNQLIIIINYFHRYNAVFASYVNLIIFFLIEFDVIVVYILFLKVPHLVFVLNLQILALIHQVYYEVTVVDKFKNN